MHDDKTSEGLNSILNELSNLDLKPLFGVELEFYILGVVSDQLLTAIAAETGMEVQKEKGITQYEIATGIFDDVFSLISYVNLTKEKIISIGISYGVAISFRPKPFPNDYGSGIHIHMSLIDKDRYNIFNAGVIDENQYLLHTIGGVLHLLNMSLAMIIDHNKEEFDRLHNSQLTPTTVSWGKNNRTTAIRIPDSHPNNRNRRIEFRVPSSSSNIANCIIFLLTSAIYGIKKMLLPGNCIYGNANYTTYNLVSLHKNVYDMKIDFRFWDIFNDLFK